MTKIEFPVYWNSLIVALDAVGDKLGHPDLINNLELLDFSGEYGKFGYGNFLIEWNLAPGKRYAVHLTKRVNE